MGEFFKQLLSQLNDIWNKLTRSQKIITSSVVLLTFLGLVLLIVWSGYSGKSSGNVTLFTGLDLKEGGDIVEQLKSENQPYSIENGGSTISVPRDKVYELRMQFAKMGLPKTGGIGYELFDQKNIGVTDFVQNLNFKRALEGEIARSIEYLDEVERARVHIVIPKETIFIERQKVSTASIVLKLKPGAHLKEGQIEGIANLVAFSVEGLDRKSISILDTEGNLLSNAFGTSEVAERTSNQLQLQNKVEGTLAKKAQDMLDGVVGPNKARVKVTAELDFNQMTETAETYDPKSKVVRSEERNDESVTNSPSEGDGRKENSITNYEINKSVKNIIGSVGGLKRVSISVAVDGVYQRPAKGERTYAPRPADEILKLEELVKTAVGYDVTRGDQIVVYNLRFDNEFIEDERLAMDQDSKRELYMEILKGVLVAVIILAFIFFLRSLAKNIIEALNPPVPEFVGVGEAPKDEPVPEEAKRTNALIEKVELLTKDDPQSVANIIRSWLSETPEKPV